MNTDAHMIACNNVVYLSIGSNVGDRLAMLRQAVAQMSGLGRVVACSPVYETAAWGLEDQPDFLNAAVCMHTPLAAIPLLQALQQIEQDLHRTRLVHWGPRTIDIDMLFFNAEVIQSPLLTVPHPYMHNRRFVLVPLADIADSMMHPVLQQTVAQLLQICADEQPVSYFDDWK